MVFTELCFQENNTVLFECNKKGFRDLNVNSIDKNKCKNVLKLTDTKHDSLYFFKFTNCSHLDVTFFSEIMLPRQSLQTTLDFCILDTNTQLYCVDNSPQQHLIVFGSLCPNPLEELNQE